MTPDLCFFVFRIHKHSETSKGPLQYIFADDNVFQQLSAMPLTCFVLQNSCSMAKRSWKLCKTSDESFLKLFLWTRKTIFWHPCEKIYPGGRNFFVLCPNMLKEKPFLYRKFFSNGSARQVESGFVKPAEKNCANGQVFFAQFPHWGKIKFFSMENSFLKMPFRTSR